MTARWWLVVLSLAIASVAGPLPLIVSLGQYVAATNDARQYDGAPSCAISPSQTDLSSDGPDCSTQLLQIVQRTPALGHPEAVAQFGYLVNDAVGRSYHLDLADTAAAREAWLQSGPPQQLRSVFFHQTPVVVSQQHSDFETLNNPDYLRQTAWFRAVRYGFVSVCEMLLAVLLLLLADSIRAGETRISPTEPILVRNYVRKRG